MEDSRWYADAGVSEVMCVAFKVIEGLVEIAVVEGEWIADPQLDAPESERAAEGAASEPHGHTAVACGVPVATTGRRRWRWWSMRKWGG